MIQLIGLIIGAYVLTRSLEIASAKNPPAVRLFAVLTFVVTVYCVVTMLYMDPRVNF